MQPLFAKFFTYIYSQSDLHAFMSQRAQQDEISVTVHCSAEASCLHQLLDTDILFNRSIIIQLLIVLEFLYLKHRHERKKKKGEKKEEKKTQQQQ